MCRLKHCCLIMSLMLLASLWTSCGAITSDDAAGFYEGETKQTERTIVGPLTFDVWQVRYRPEVSSAAPGDGVMVQTGGTNLFLKVQNAGETPIVLFESGIGKPLPPSLPTVYLEDQLQRRYQVKGTGSSRASSEPEGFEGTAFPGKLTEIDLRFDDIPRDVTALTLHWDIGADDGETYALTMPVPLPKAQ